VVDSVGIVGLGLIGGSLGRRLVNAGCRVVAWNHDPRPYPLATADGIDCVESLEDLAASKPDVLVLCNPLKAMPSLLRSLNPVLDREATTLTDVGSVKAQVRAEVSAAGLDDCYVGAHPMAGTEFSGFEASDPTLFDGALWALTVDDRTSFTRLQQVAGMVTRQVGNRVIVIDDATHDRAAAMISHMPHAVSTALVNMLVDSNDRNVAIALAAGSWRDMTRVALTDPARTRAMIDENPANVVTLLRDLSAALNGFADDLEDGNQPALERFFAAGQPYRQYKSRQADVAQGQGVKKRTLDISEANWRGELIESARRGEQILRFATPTQAEVVVSDLK
jgi:prephenate dehydrogenase